MNPVQTAPPRQAYLYKDDLVLTPFQAQELNALYMTCKDDSQKAKLNSMSFYNKDPILQPNGSEVYVYKSTIKTFNQNITNPLNVNGGAQLPEYQWRSTLRKTEPIKPMISSYQRKEMKGLPERRVLKTVKVNNIQRNPLVSDGNFTDRPHLQYIPAPTSMSTQIVWEQREVLPADRKISPPKYKTYGYLPKAKILSSYY